MHKLICDFCGEEIRPSSTFITVTEDISQAVLGSRWDTRELHFHMDCATRLRHKVNQFIAEVRERKENDDRAGEK